jgi:hypothetical protein
MVSEIEMDERIIHETLEAELHAEIAASRADEAPDEYAVSAASGAYDL